MRHVFVGFDTRQPIACTVAQSSIVIRASEPVAVTPLVIETLPIERKGLTSFTYSRFLVPWLMGFRDEWALFIDSDMLCRADVCELFRLADPSKAVMVPEIADPTLQFERAAVMLFNCGHPDNRQLTPEYVEGKRDGTLIGWTDAVGALPKGWNHLVGYDPPNKDAKLVHFTQGIPAFEETKGCEFEEEWRWNHRFANHTVAWRELMGTSIHATRDAEGNLMPKFKAA